MNNSTDYETERNAIKNAYSYIRLSSKKQLGKSGESRQADKPQIICDTNGWHLQKKTFSDLGISGWTGDNLLKGALSEFIKLAKAGSLAPNPVLILESFDRFSRQDIDESEVALMDLLKSGVAVHVVFSNKTFTKSSTKDLASRIEILVSMKSAFDYSENLSKRVSSAKQRKITAIANGESVNINEMSPSWVTWNKSTRNFTLNNHYTAVKRIFEEYLQGESAIGIARRLNQDGVPSFSNGKWNPNSIRYVLSSRSVLGEFKGKIVFPKIISITDFNKVESMLERNKGRRGRRSDLVNIFRSLVFCSTCGHPMSMTKNKGRHYAHYRCTYNGTNQCTNNRCSNSHYLEGHFFAGILQSSPEEFLSSGETKYKEQLSILTTKRGSLKKKIDVLLNLDDDFNADDLKQKYTTLRTELKEVETQLTTLRGEIDLASNAPKALTEIAEFFKSDPGPTEDTDTMKPIIDRMYKTLSDLEIRKKLQVLMPSIIKGIYIGDKQEFKVVFTNGKESTDVIDALD